MTDKLLRRSLAADDLPPPAVPFLLPADGGELSVDVRAEPGGSAANTSTSSFGSFGTFRGNMKPIRWSEDSPCPAASSGLAASRISAVGGSRSASDGGGTKSGDSGRLSLPAYMVVQTPTSAQPPVTVQARNCSNRSPKMTSAVGNERNTANGDGAKVKPQTQPRKVTAPSSAVPNNVNVVPPTSSTSTAVPALTTLTTASRTTAPLTLPRPSQINSPVTPDTRSCAAATGAIKPTTTSTASVSATSGPTGTSVSEATTANFSVAAAARVQSNRISTCSAVIDDVFIPEPAPDYATDDDQHPEPLLDDLLLPAPEGYAFDLPPPVFEFGDDVTLPNEINWQDDLPEVELHNDELIASKAYVTTADPCLEAEDDIDLLTSDLQLHVNTSLNGGAVPLLTSEDLAVARDTVETLSLAVRQFVTDSKNFVSAAAAVDVIEFGTCVEAAMHTLAGIVTCCRRLLVIRSPGDGGVSGVVSGVLDTARTFRTTVEAGRLTGLCTTDAEIEESKNDVLEQAGELATSLSRLVQAVRILAQQQ